MYIAFKSKFLRRRSFVFQRRKCIPFTFISNVFWIIFFVFFGELFWLSRRARQAARTVCFVFIFGDNNLLYSDNGHAHVHNEIDSFTNLRSLNCNLRTNDRYVPSSIVLTHLIRCTNHILRFTDRHNECTLGDCDTLRQLEVCWLLFCDRDKLWLISLRCDLWAVSWVYVIRKWKMVMKAAGAMEAAAGR